MNSFLSILKETADLPGKKNIRLHELEYLWETAKQFEINRIIESGTYYGLTAIRLNKLYPECSVYTFEIRKERWRKIPKEHLGKNIYFKHGELINSINLVTSDSLVVIDGPKRERAINLARKCAKIVPIVGIHDMLEYEYLLKKTFVDYRMCGVLAVVTLKKDVIFPC